MNYQIPFQIRGQKKSLIPHQFLAAVENEPETEAKY